MPYSSAFKINPVKLLQSYRAALPYIINGKGKVFCFQLPVGFLAFHVSDLTMFTP